MTPHDAQARDRIATELHSTLVVEAAAGTGKTTALVGRVVALVRTGTARLAQVVAVTFTEKAAGEMKLRLREELESARQKAADEERERLDDALAELETARIGTIHSLCADLLRERPIEAGIDPMFEVAAEDESARLFDQAFERWFQDTLADPPEGVRRVLRREPRRQEYRPRHALRAAGWALAEHRDFREPWRRDPFDREAAIDAIMDALGRLGELGPHAKNPDNYLARNLEEVRRWVDEVRHREAVSARDHDGLEAALRDVRTWRSWRWKGFAEYGPGLDRDEVLAQRDGVKSALDTLVQRCDADLAPCLHEELWPLVERYEALKARAGVLDFFDLLARTRSLLVNHAAVRQELQGRFSHLLVDEFQDTDPLQTDVVLLLSAADPAVSDPDAVRVRPGKLFLVGDPKQSIYRFRRADVAFYQQVKQRLVADGAQVVHLSTSFRSDPRLQKAVNAAFASRMVGPTQAGYVPLEPSRAEVPGRPALIGLPVPEPYADYGKVTRWRIEESLPQAVAAWVDWLLHESGWQVSEPDTGDMVAVQPRHVCLLFRRFQSFGNPVTTPYTQALEARQLPHVLVGGRSFHEREEVEAVRNALSAIEWPDDELSVFATLRGPLFALGDDALLAWRHQVGRLHPLGPVRDGLSDVLVDVADALAVLGDLHRRRNRRPIADTVGRLLDATRAQAGLALWSAGEQVLANVLRVAHQARRYELGGATSFRAFVDHLAAEAERGESAEAPVVEEGTDGVRVMTVHKAKGLEFPVVVLCDITCRAFAQRPSRHVDAARRLWAEPIAGCQPVELIDNADEVLRRDAEEADRLLYVACTRARDVLVVPAVADEPLEGWLDALHDVLYPPDDARHLAGVAPGCPPLGDDTTARRPMKASRVRPLRPGVHRPMQGDHDVVWWGPAALHLDVAPPSGLRHQAILVEDDGGSALRGEQAHLAWVQARSERLVRAAVPELRVVTPTDLGEASHLPVPVAQAIPIEDTGVRREGRPHGKRFGMLVHGVLADIALGADPAAVRLGVALHARLVGADEQEQAAGEAAVVAALGHDVLRRAAASPDCRRESPLTLRAPDGSLIEGTADLVFREALPSPRWVVVDFKTDVELAARQEAYEVQLGWYVRAVESATGEPALGVLLRV